MPLHPQVKKILEEAASLELPDYQDLSPAAARKQMLDLTPPVDPSLAVERVENLMIPGRDGEIPIRLYYPSGDPPFAVLVYFHGGGWVMGDLDTHHGVCHALAKLSGCLVVSVDYRLAPEHRYPAAVEDAYAATSWVAQHTGAIQADPDRLAVGGDSAGGHLAAVVALMAQDHFIEDEGQANDPYVSPLRAKNFSNLPQALIITAEYDPLRDEGQAYGKKLQEAGVKVTLSRYPGMIHGFIRMAARLDAAKEALNEIAGRLKGVFRTHNLNA
jgi:acetyl esterase